MTPMQGNPALDSAPGTTALLAGPAGQRVLVVDDEPIIRSLCKITLSQLDLICDDAIDGPRALQAVRERPCDLVLLDIDMPGMSGWEVCKQLRLMRNRAHLKIILFSGRAHPDDLAKMLLAGADDYLTKPFSGVQLGARVQAGLQHKRTQERMDRINHELLVINRAQEKLMGEQVVEARNALVLALAKVVESRNRETGEHLQRLQDFSRRLAEQAIHEPALSEQIDQNFIDLLACCAPLHDIGKVGLPDSILLKPGKLDSEERRLMQKHTIIGAATLREVAQRHQSALPFLEMSIDIARHHHERFDGAGYPDGLHGDDIPLSARIVAIGDVYDAMRSPRCYKEALPHDEVVAYIVAGAGAHFDPILTQSFLRCADDFARIYAELSD